MPNIHYNRDVRPINGAFKGRGRDYLALLTCPLDGARLRLDEGAVRCTAEAAHVYPFEDGILRLARLAMRGKGVPAGGLTPERLAAAARSGVPGARRAWEDAGRYLGLGLVGLVNLLNPDVIVVGGGISAAGGLLLGPARRVVRERALAIPARHVRIVRSAFGQDSGAIGAASEAFAALHG